MIDKYQKLFRSLRQVEPSENLPERILSRISRIQQQQNRLWFFISTAATLGSSILMFNAIQYTIGEFYLSNFYQYLSLIFTDGRSLFPFSKELAFSLTESIPLFGITALLLAVLILLYSIKIYENKFQRVLAIKSI